jgi:hypothetical protein
MSSKKPRAGSDESRSFLSTTPEPELQEPYRKSRREASTQVPQDALQYSPVTLRQISPHRSKSYHLRTVHTAPAISVIVLRQVCEAKDWRV